MPRLQFRHRCRTLMAQSLLSHVGAVMLIVSMERILSHVPMVIRGTNHFPLPEIRYVWCYILEMLDLPLTSNKINIDLPHNLHYGSWMVKTDVTAVLKMS